MMSAKQIRLCCSVLSLTLLTTPLLADPGRDWAKLGWATQGGGTRGGADASNENLYTVRTRDELLESLKRSGDTPKIIQWVGRIDMSDGRRFANQADQRARAEIRIPSNTTILGIGSDAELVDGWMMIKDVRNVIVRNMKIINPCDHNPEWDPNDGDGNYNSEFDGISVIGASNIWFDHLYFTDAPYTEDKKPIGNVDKKGKAKIVECHDGALDIKEGSEYITVSNTKFELHSKNNLIGHSDKSTVDEGKLTVTFAYNIFQDISERSPRVRFGRVHVFNNYYEGDKNRAHHAHNYSIGTGYRSRILSENNVFEIAGAKPGNCPDVVHNPGRQPELAFRDSGSLLNGQTLSNCLPNPAIDWTVPYSYTVMPAELVKDHVKLNVGPGKL